MLQRSLAPKGATPGAWASARPRALRARAAAGCCLVGCVGFLGPQPVRGRSCCGRVQVLAGRFTCHSLVTTSGYRRCCGTKKVRHPQLVGSSSPAPCTGWHENRAWGLGTGIAPAEGSRLTMCEPWARGPALLSHYKHLEGGCWVCLQPVWSQS